MIYLALHAIEKRLFAVLRCRPYVDRMQTLAMPVVQRNAAGHGFPPLLVADQHAGAIDPDTNRRNLTQLRRGVTPTLLLSQHAWPNPANWPSCKDDHDFA